MSKALVDIKSNIERIDEMKKQAAKDAVAAIKEEPDLRKKMDLFWAAHELLDTAPDVYEMEQFGYVDGDAGGFISDYVPNHYARYDVADLWSVADAAIGQDRPEIACQICHSGYSYVKCDW